jgi:hypothetical protein
MVVLSGVFMHILLLFTPESPHYLHSKHKFTELRSAINYISEINGKGKFEGLFLEENHQIEEDKEYPFSKMLKDPIHK